MNTLFSYALKSLQKNKARTLMTILGITMSAALIVALATLCTSLYRYAEEGYIYENGDWHLGITAADRQDVENLLAESDTQNPFRAKSIGYARIDITGSTKPYLYLQGVESAYYEHMPVHLTEGRVPEREGEILLPESLRRIAEDSWQIDSILTLETGLRLKDGKVLWQHVPYGYDEQGMFFQDSAEETLQQQQKQSYLVVGFYDIWDSNSIAPGFTALTWWDGRMEDDGYHRFSLWFQVADINNTNFHAAYDRVRLVYDYNGLQLPVNLGLLSLYGVRISSGGESKAVVAVVIILLLIILTGSVMLIYNAFAISVGERTKQFGLLSSIGATRKQIRKSVLYEAAIVSAAGILLGVLAGIAVVELVLQGAGELVANLMEFSIKPRLYVWFPAVLGAAVVALFTVLVSAWIPAKRATRVTAIEAIRQTRDIKYSGKQKKVLRFVERLFGFEGTLAVIYSGRNRKRYRVTTISLFLSMVLFVSMNAFSDYLMTVIQTEYKTTNYEVLVQLPDDPQLTESEYREVLEGMRELSDVDSVTQVSYYTYKMPYEENAGHVTTDFGEILETTTATGGRKTVSISVIDDKSFSDFCREHGLEESRFLDIDNLTVIVKNNFNTTDKKTGNTKLIHGLTEEGSRFYVDLASGYSYVDSENHHPLITAFTAGYFVESLAPGCNDNYNLSIMLPEQVAKALALENTADYTRVSYCLTTSEHRRVTEAAAEFLETKYPGSTVYDQAEKQTGNRNLVFMLRLLANGFIIMIAVISIANVFSTISSNLMLRQKEFAMLKTVGITQQGLRRMLNLECLLYGGKAVLFGLPVSILIAAVMYFYFRRDVIFDFFLPVPSILIAVGSIFAVVFITMLYTMGRIRKENVIDVLKQENF